MLQLRDTQAQRLAELARHGAADVVEPVPGSLVVITYEWESGRPRWVEILEPEPTSLHAWDLGGGS